MSTVSLSTSMSGRRMTKMLEHDGSLASVEGDGTASTEMDYLEVISKRTQSVLELELFEWSYPYLYLM